MYSDASVFAALAQFDVRRSGQSEVEAQVADGAAVHRHILNGLLALSDAQREILFDAALLVHHLGQRLESSRQVAVNVHEIRTCQVALLIEQPAVKHHTERQIQLQRKNRK